MPMQVSRLLLLLLRLMQLPRLVVCFFYYYVAVDDPGFRFVCLLLLLCGVTLPEFCCTQSYAKQKAPENGPNGNWHPISGSQPIPSRGERTICRRLPWTPSGSLAGSSVILRPFPICLNSSQIPTHFFCFLPWINPTAVKHWGQACSVD